MAIINLTKELFEQYQKGERVFLYDDNNVELFITIDSGLCYTKRINGKKFGCYLLSQQDKERINTNKSSLFYDGKTKVYIKKTVKADL